MASRRVKRIHFLIDTQLFRLPSPDYVDSDSNCGIFSIIFTAPHSISARIGHKIPREIIKNAIGMLRYYTA
jgi:hypothetical protein